MSTDPRKSSVLPEYVLYMITHTVWSGWVDGEGDVRYNDLFLPFSMVREYVHKNFGIDTSGWTGSGLNLGVSVKRESSLLEEAELIVKTNQDMMELIKKLWNGAWW